MSVLELNGRVFDASTTGTLTLTGEGSATTNVTQGLAKVWVDLDGTGTISIDNSFNIGSVTDNATGNYTFTYSSNMANANYAGGSICGNRALSIFSSRATSNTNTLTQDHNDGTNEVDKLTTLLLCGDLA